MTLARLSPNNVFDYTFYHLVNSFDREQLEYKIKPDFDKKLGCYSAKFNFKKMNMILCNPASDYFQLEYRNAGTVLLAHLLEWIVGIQKKEKEAFFIIPLAECHGEIRKHWTFLLIFKQECHFYDPKKERILGLYSYSLDPLIKIIEQHHFKLIKKNYINCQADLDNESCGYFVAKLISQLAIPAVTENSINLTLSENLDVSLLVKEFHHFYPLLFDKYYCFIRPEIRRIRGEAYEIPPPDLGVIALGDEFEAETKKSQTTLKKRWVFDDHCSLKVLIKKRNLATKPARMQTETEIQLEETSVLTF